MHKNKFSNSFLSLLLVLLLLLLFSSMGLTVLSTTTSPRRSQFDILTGIDITNEGHGKEIDPYKAIDFYSKHH